MEPTTIIFVGISLGLILVIALLVRGLIRADQAVKKLENKPLPVVDKVGVTLAQRNAIQLQEIRKDMAKLPGKVLDSVTSSGNNQKGRLGELIGYLKLNAEYDKVIAFGDITDFIGIRFEKPGCAGSIDFIDIKNGPHAKLTKDQSRFKKLIEAKRINFVKLKVDTEVS